MNDIDPKDINPKVYELFDEYEENGRVLFQFVTKLYYAKRS